MRVATEGKTAVRLALSPHYSLFPTRAGMEWQAGSAADPESPGFRRGLLFNWDATFGGGLTLATNPRPASQMSARSAFSISVFFVIVKGEESFCSADQRMMLGNPS